MAKGKTAKTAKAGNAKRKAKAPAKPKPTVKQLSDQQRQALLFQHKRKLAPLLSAESAAKAAVTKAYELAKKEGIPKSEILLALRLESEAGIEKVKAEVERTSRIARWLGVGKQLDLFGSAEKQIAAERHYEDGRRAALNDEPPKPPGHLGVKDADTWLSGHAAGRKTLNTERAQGFQKLGDVAAGLAPKVPPKGDAFPPPPANGGIGTEPATHQVQ